MINLDILGIFAHPDDAELTCGGTLIKHNAIGHNTGVLDLTKGELGTRGTPEIRMEEANKAKKILNLLVRDNMNFKDGWFQNDEAHQLALIKKIREYRPKIVITNAIYDRHPDHGKAADLVEVACFKAGLPKIETLDEKGNPQKAHTITRIYFSIQSTPQQPNFYVDISEHFDKKMDSIKAYFSQFHNPNVKEPETYISTPHFMNMIESRAIEYGHRIGVKYAEGFITKQFLGIKNLFDLI